MNSRLSVIICSHNPRPEYLGRTLEALKSQTVPRGEWELLLVDNASKNPLSEQWDLSWHPRACTIREEELGLTPARLRGIKESKGDLLVFVDDDNVLEPDYLQQAIKIGQEHDSLGIFGGRIDPEFEENPAEWMRPYWGYLALRQVERSSWSNETGNYAAFPYGAGVCVRRKVAEAYAGNVALNAQARAMGRKGTALISGEDTEMALTACDLGCCHGIFVELRLLHLMPKSRVTEDYMLRLLEGTTYSLAMLKARRDGTRPEPAKARLRLALGWLRRWLFMGRTGRLVVEARERGLKRSEAELKEDGTMVSNKPALSQPSGPALLRK